MSLGEPGVSIGGVRILRVEGFLQDILMVGRTVHRETKTMGIPNCFFPSLSLFFPGVCLRPSHPRPQKHDETEVKETTKTFQLMVYWWFGLVVWDSRATPK